MKQLLSYILLCSVLLLSIPRAWTHDCEHDDHEMHLTDEDSVDKEDCVVCDLDVTLDGVSELVLFKVRSIVFESKKLDVVSTFCKGEHTIYSDRGPPLS